MANCSAGEFSELPRIADFFHSFPHENFYFDNVSSTFIPTLPDYQQVSELYIFFVIIYPAQQQMHVSSNVRPVFYSE